jgi:hypothetical protein
MRVENRRDPNDHLLLHTTGIRRRLTEDDKEAVAAAAVEEQRKLVSSIMDIFPNSDKFHIFLYVFDTPHVVVKEGESTAKITGAMTLESLEATLLAKIQEIQSKMQNTQDAEELQKLGTVLNDLLETLERTRKAKNA